MKNLYGNSDNMNETVLPSLNISDTEHIIKDPSTLSAGILPHYKGWSYQTEVQSHLDNIGVKYEEGASTDFYEFLKHGNNVEGYDIKLKNGLKIEAKYRSPQMQYTIFDKDFEKEYLNKDCDFIVTNNVNSLSSSQRGKLQRKGVPFLSTEAFVEMMIMLFHHISKTIPKIVTTLRIGIINILSNVQSTIARNTTRSVVQDSTLDKFLEITAPTSTKTENRHPLYECYCCKRRMYCETLQRIDSLRIMKPYKTQEQCLLVPTTNRKTKPFKQRLEEWRKEYRPLKAKQFLCLERRIFLHTKKNFNLFDTENHSGREY